LVVVVVGNEILDGVLRKQRAELLEQLGGEGFVVGQHQGGALRTFDYACNSECFAAARNTEQNLILRAIAKTAHDCVDGRGLITLWLIL
jgi:hypothetical protein